VKQFPGEIYEQTDIVTDVQVLSIYTDCINLHMADKRTALCTVVVDVCLSVQCVSDQLSVSMCLYVCLCSV